MDSDKSNLIVNIDIFFNMIYTHTHISTINKLLHGLVASGLKSISNYLFLC
jgi:hypothetical protein